jgi:proteasome lid subunit RPN8/RPN11
MIKLQIKPEHDQYIRDHGRRAFPHECCGFMLGRDSEGTRVISIVMAATNIRGEEELHNRFTVNPEAHMKAIKMARAEKLDVLGYYHSHPNAPARPSQYDLDHAWPICSYVIVAVADGEPAKMTSWIMQGDREKFNEQEISIQEAE